MGDRHVTRQVPFLDDFQRKGEKGSKTLVSENRPNLKFIIFRRTLAGEDPGMSRGLRDLWESGLMACIRLLPHTNVSYSSL